MTYDSPHADALILNNTPKAMDMLTNGIASLAEGSISDVQLKLVKCAASFAFVGGLLTSYAVVLDWGNLSTMVADATSLLLVETMFGQLHTPKSLETALIQAHVLKGTINKNSHMLVGNKKKKALVKAYSRTATAYGIGVQFLETANEKWKALIGDEVYETTFTNKYRCFCTISGEATMSVVENQWDCFTDNLPDKCTAIPIYETKFMAYGSDGVVPKPSQAAMPNTNYKVLVPHNNHFQIRNSTQTRSTHFDVFDGKNGLFFKTDVLR